MKSTKFVTACYILSFVAHNAPERISTGTIARWVNTNAARVRQLVAELVRAGLLQSTRGGHGGVVLARDPAGMTLLEVCDAVAGQELELFAIDNPFSAWQDRCHVHAVLTKMRTELDGDLRRRMAATTVAELFAAPAAHARRRPRTRARA